MEKFDETNLIFIISTVISGSTLLQRILKNIDGVETKSEPWFLLKFLDHDTNFSL